jgi:ABC-2 type transport system ATP-binding protein
MSEAILELRDFTIRYSGGFAVGPVNGKLPRGLYHLRGENGCGKTSLMRGLCAELKAHRGACLLAGEDLWSTPSARARVGYLPARSDQPEFLTVEEAWRLHAVMRGAPGWDGHARAEALGLPPKLMLSHASSGQRRRAELVCALAGDPLLLLLDEPFANLDVDGVALLAGWLEELREDAVIILTHHGEPPNTPDQSWTVAPNMPLEWTLG